MIFYDEKRAVQSLTIDCSILGKTKLAYIFIIYLLLIQEAEIHIAVYYAESMCCSDIDISVLTLNDRSYRRRSKSIRNAVTCKLAPLHHGNAVIICSDPESVLTVYIETYNAGDTCCRIKTFEGISIISDKSTVAADPYKAFACLGDGIRLGGRKSAGIIIEYR